MKELGLYENSLIILTSDHGEEFFDHEAWLHDHSVYEEAIRIPLIIKFPHSQYKGQKVQQIVSIIDIMPTILDALNIRNSSLSIDGQSLFSLITEKETQDRSFAVDLAHREYRDVCPTVIAMNQGSYKFIHNKKIKSPYVARVSKNFGDEQTELYDLKNDPKETKNIVLQIENRDLCFDLLNSIKEYCEKFSPEILNGERVTMDDSLLERLRALGYIR
jgi:arylsulfatase A-like enzyme